MWKGRDESLDFVECGANGDGDRKDNSWEMFRDFCVSVCVCVYVRVCLPETLEGVE